MLSSWPDNKRNVHTSLLYAVTNIYFRYLLMQLQMYEYLNTNNWIATTPASTNKLGIQEIVVRSISKQTIPTKYHLHEAKDAA